MEWRLDNYWPPIDWSHVERVSRIDMGLGHPRLTAIWERRLAWMKAGEPLFEGAAMFIKPFQGWYCAGCGSDERHHVRRQDVAESINGRESELFRPERDVLCLPCAWWFRSGLRSAAQARPASTPPQMAPEKWGQLSLFD